MMSASQQPCKTLLTSRVNSSETRTGREEIFDPGLQARGRSKWEGLTD